MSILRLFKLDRPGPRVAGSTGKAGSAVITGKNRALLAGSTGKAPSSLVVWR